MNDELTDEPECEWSEYLNDYDDPIDAYCSPGYVLTGLHSVHKDKHEDRLWKMKCCKVKFGQPIIKLYVFKNTPTLQICQSLEHILTDAI